MPKIRSTAIKGTPKAQRTPVNTATPADSQTEKRKDIGKPVLWGDKNTLPDEILNAIMDSGTAARCWSKLDSFLQADGFANPTAAAFRVNPKQTADGLLSSVSSVYSYLDGFALRVKYGLDLKEKEVYHVPAHTVRKTENGFFIVNPTYGTKKVDKKQDEILEPYNPDPEVVQAMLNQVADAAERDEQGNIIKLHQPGQLLFVYHETPRSPQYPVPVYWTLSGAKDIYSDTEISITDLDNLENNFTPPVIVHFEGDVDDTKVGEDGKTEYDRLEENVASLTDKENRSQAVLLTGNAKPSLVAWDNSKPILALDAKRETIGRAVCRHMGVPPLLVGFYQSGALSQSKEIINAVALLNAETNKKQRVISRVFQTLFPQTDPDFWNITTLNPINEIPAEILAKMTDDEIRNLGGLAPLPQKQTNESETILNSLNSLSPLVANKVLESMTTDEIRALIGLGAGTKPETATANPAENADN